MDKIGDVEILDLIIELRKKCSEMDQDLMDRLNLSQSELMFFSSLKNCMGINSNELARTMGLSASRVSRVIDKLVVNGYLDRNIDASDRRAITLCLTEEGRKVRREIDQKRGECEARMKSALPSGELEKFREMVVKMIGSL